MPGKMNYYLSRQFSQITICICIACKFIFARGSDSTSDKCENGEYVIGQGCVCFDGWQGSSCQSCGSKIRLLDTSGFIFDGSGNYSANTKCTWLIDTGGSPNVTIRLHVEEFATECGWDILYIFDGDNVNSALLAVFSGIKDKEDSMLRKIPEVVAKSGSALLYFYSDAANTMSGFNISYRFNSCPSSLSAIDCSGHGICINGSCICEAMYMGEACQIEICPSRCLPHGECSEEKQQCVCHTGFKGDDCSQMEDAGYWEMVKTNGFIPVGSASHESVVWRNSLYIVGGESYHRAKLVYKYDFHENVWDAPHNSSEISPNPRYGHTAVLSEEKIYIYGGLDDNGATSAELWAFDVNSESWENITVNTRACNSSGDDIYTVCGPLKSSGHSANVVNGKGNNGERMIIIFGHSPIYGYLNTVQEFQFSTREWRIVKTNGYSVKGGYGHTSAKDPLTQTIYVYGGFVSEDSLTAVLSSNLYSYEPDTRQWIKLMSGPSAQFLHTANFITAGIMLVLGGSTDDGTSYNHRGKCYSTELLVYDTVCDSWNKLNVPSWLQEDLARFGHTAATFDGSLYIYGGFDGQMLNDMIRYVPGRCESLTNASACAESSALRGIKCVWDESQGCINISGIDLHAVRIKSKCSDRNVVCSELKNCSSCTYTSHICVWLNDINICTHSANYNTSLHTASETCENDHVTECKQIHNCQACSIHRNCQWYDETQCKAIVNLSNLGIQGSDLCHESCSQYTSCWNCTSAACIWCQSEGLCLDRNAYVTSFPYRQCREWTVTNHMCRSSAAGKSPCSFYKTCSECRDDPACGWCDDNSGTGLGVCLPGGSSGSISAELSCPKLNWFFTHCPGCQCNGHSSCNNGSNICNKPCANLTEGSHCDRCISGFFGNPANGGKCKACECNMQATQCDPKTGKCFCKTKGIIGDHCEHCDTRNNYLGDPTNNGSCFYELTTDYRYTFNLSKKEDQHYTQIIFKNSPLKPDIDTDFEMTSSLPVKLNIYVHTQHIPEDSVVSTGNLTSFSHRFTKEKYLFGAENNVPLTTFSVCVYDIHVPILLQIYFAQYPIFTLR